MIAGKAQVEANDPASARKTHVEPWAKIPSICPADIVGLKVQAQCVAPISYCMRLNAGFWVALTKLTRRERRLHPACRFRVALSRRIARLKASSSDICLFNSSIAADLFEKSY